MTTLSPHPPLGRRLTASLRTLRGLTPDELAQRRLRRRLLRFILENHQRREAQRGLGQSAAGAHA